MNNMDSLKDVAKTIIDMKTLNQEITLYLIKNGFNPSFKGFSFLRYAIATNINNKISNKKVTGEDGLYEEISKFFNVNPHTVERDLRYLVKNNKNYTEELAILAKDGTAKQAIFTVIETFAINNNYDRQELGLLKDADNIRLLVRSNNVETDGQNKSNLSYFYNCILHRSWTSNKQSEDNDNTLHYATGYNQTSPLFDENNVFLPKASDEEANLKYFTTILTYHNNNDISMEGVIRQIPSQIIENVRGIELVNLGLDDYQTVYNPETQKEQKFIHTRLYVSQDFEEEI